MCETAILLKKKMTWQVEGENAEDVTPAMSWIVKAVVIMVIIMIIRSLAEELKHTSVYPQRVL